MKSFLTLALIFYSFISFTNTAIAADDTPKIDPALELIHALGCKACHIINGEGGSIATDLTQIGSRMSAEQIKEHLIADPTTRINGFMPSYSSLSEKDLDHVSEYLYSLP